MVIFMKFLTKDDVKRVQQQSDYCNQYYTGRWDYLNELIEEIKKMDGVEKTLELGPFRTPLVVGGDVMDVEKSNLDFYPIKIGKFFHRDGSNLPYPIEDNYYDLIIASQVLEHLGIYGEQKNVFDEFKRISKKAIISLPYKWFAPDERDHHMIDEKVIRHWTNNYKPSFEVIKGVGDRKRIISVYDFE